MGRMTEKSYEFWTKLCGLGAVASAVVFDKAGHLNWLVGAFGIVSTIIGIVIYFYNAGGKKDESREERADSYVNVVPLPVVNNSMGIMEAPHHGEISANQLAFWSLKADQLEVSEQRTITFYVDSSARSALYHYRKKVEEEQKQVRESRMFVDEVVEIVQRLSPTCEFEWNLGGHLTIRPRAQTVGIEPYSLGFVQSDSPDDIEPKKEHIN
jgi:hypothetical protein